MHAFDVFILIFLTGFIVYGLLRGFARQIFALAGIILGVYISYTFGNFLSSILPFSQVWAKLLSYLLLFLIVYISSIFLGKGIQKILKKIHLGGIDASLGGIMGFLKGFLLVFIVIYFLKEIGYPIEKYSFIAEHILKITEIIKPIKGKEV